MIARHHHILGIPNGIVKLYPISKSFLTTMDVMRTYLIIHACDNPQTAGKAEDKIVGGTMQK